MHPNHMQDEVVEAPVPVSGSLRITNEYLLVRELTHKLNNDYASMIAFASRISTRSDSNEVRAALSEVINLLHNYANVHCALQMPTFDTIMDASTYIRALCQSIKRARLDQRDIELVLVETPLPLQSEQCWKLGMIVAELITNTVRHAFCGQGGSIRIELSSFGRYVQCSYMDNGSSTHSSTQGQGLRIIEALASGLNGKIVHRFGIGGATSVLIFPMPRKTLETAPPGQMDASESSALDPVKDSRELALKRPDAEICFVRLMGRGLKTKVGAGLKVCCGVCGSCRTLSHENSRKFLQINASESRFGVTTASADRERARDVRIDKKRVVRTWRLP